MLSPMTASLWPRGSQSILPGEAVCLKAHMQNVCAVTMTACANDQLSECNKHSRSVCTVVVTVFKLHAWIPENGALCQCIGSKIFTKLFGDLARGRFSKSL